MCPGHVADHLTVGTFDAVAAAIALDALDADGPADADRIDRAVCLARFGTGFATAPQVVAEPDLAGYAG
ncbi:MAG: hypothetical protein L0I24_17000 [Pseudonocardia sp.]|nr:hypothetical protein [Pseudonocardia sp.]